MTTPPPNPPPPDDGAPDAAAQPTPPSDKAKAKHGHPRTRGKAILLFLLLVPLVLLALYITIMLNYAYSTGSKAGYVQQFEDRGWLCKTHEGELLITSAPGVPTETWRFSVRDDSIAKVLTSTVNQRVLVFYEEHRGLPTNCFGATDYFVDSVVVR